MGRFLPIVFLVSCGVFSCNQTEGSAVVRCTTAPQWPGHPGLPSEFEADFFSLQLLDELVEIRLQKGGKGADLAEGFQIHVVHAKKDLWQVDCLNQNVTLYKPILGEMSPESLQECGYDEGCVSSPRCPLVRMVAHFPGECTSDCSPLVGGDMGGDAEQEPSFFNFVSLGTRSGETVSGSFDVAVRDARTGTLAGRCKTANNGFSFVVKDGQPYVRFIEQ